MTFWPVISLSTDPRPILLTGLTLSETQKIKAVLFDLDGTLIDSFAPILHSFNQTLSELHTGIVLTHKKMLGLVGCSLDDSFRKLLPETEVERASGLFRAIYAPLAGNQTQLMSGARELLSFLVEANIPFAVVTNKMGEEARVITKSLGICPPALFTLGEGDGFPEKPAPDMIQEALSRIGASCEKTLFVGDSPWDFHAARAASVPVCLIPTGTHQKEELMALSPDWLFDDLEKLHRHLKEN